MSLFAWKDSYGIGVPEVDIQHRRLFTLADELHEALNKAGVTEKLVVLKGASHGFQGADLQTAIAAVLEFLSAHLK